MGFKIVLVVISYFIGNISPSIILGKLFGGIDIREHGSGNAGTTNTLRTLGKKAAVATLIIDVFKGVAAVLLGRYFGGQELAMVCGLAVFLGHIWPLAFGFRGGKGVATILGVAMALEPRTAAVCIIIGLIIIINTKRVSPGALIGILAFPLITIWFILRNGGFAVMSSTDVYMLIWGILVTVIVWWKHRANIQRILKGEEPKLSFRRQE